MTDMTTALTAAMLEIKRHEPGEKTIVHPNQSALMIAIIGSMLKPVKSQNKNQTVEKNQKKDLLQPALQLMKRERKLPKSSASGIWKNKTEISNVNKSWLKSSKNQSRTS